MTSAQVVETSVTNNSSFQNYLHPDDHTIRTIVWALSNYYYLFVCKKKQNLTEETNHERIVCVEGMSYAQDKCETFKLDDLIYKMTEFF